MFKRYLLTVFFGIFVVLASSTLPMAEANEKQLKMGTVNLPKIFDEYKRTQDADAKLGSEGQMKQEEREKTVAEIRRLKDELELLSDSGRAGKQEVIDNKIKELRDFDQKAREGLRLKRDEMVKEILREIQEEIDAYSQAKNYDLILSDRMLLYTNGGIDITNEILTILNSKYEGPDQ